MLSKTGRSNGATVVMNETSFSGEVNNANAQRFRNAGTLSFTDSGFGGGLSLKRSRSGGRIGGGASLSGSSLLNRLGNVSYPGAPIPLTSVGGSALPPVIAGMYDSEKTSSDGEVPSDPIVTNRRLTGFSPYVSAIRAGQLAIIDIKSASGEQMNTIKIRDGVNTSGVTMQCNRIRVFTPETANWFLFMEQKDQYDKASAAVRKTKSHKDMDVFYNTSPREVLSMYHMSIDGVPLSSDPIVTSGDKQDRFVAMALKNHVTMRNYWGQSIMVGHTLYMGVKRMSVIPSDVSRISMKQGGSSISSTRLYNTKDLDFEPHMIFFFALPNEGRIPKKIRRYTKRIDGEDIFEYDAAIMKIGMVTHVPPTHIYRKHKGTYEPFVGLLDKNGMPYNDGLSDNSYNSLHDIGVSLDCRQISTY